MTSTLLPWQRVLARAAGAVGKPVAVLAGRSRRREICRARWAAILVLRESGLSYARIGKRLGGRDHSTIIHAEREGLKLLGSDAGFTALVGELRTLLAGTPSPLPVAGRAPVATGAVRLPTHLRALNSFDFEERDAEVARRKMTAGSAALAAALARYRPRSNYNVVIGA